MHALLASKYRKAANVAYPNTFATAEQAQKDPMAFAFNCGMSSHFISLRSETWRK
jgi:glutathione S-transferase